MPILYGVEPELSAQEFRSILVASTLAERRPAAESYYPKIGMKHLASCWAIPRAR